MQIDIVAASAIAACTAGYAACGALVAWLLGIPAGHVAWFACILVWPALILAALVAFSGIVTVLAILRGVRVEPRP